jgi:hypothetical protein
LHNLIIKRIVSPFPFDQKVDLVEVMNELGGKTIADSHGALRVMYEGISWDMQAGSDKAVSSGRSVFLKGKLVHQGNSFYIAAADLQKLFGTQISYNNNTGKFFRRVTPSIK